MDIQRIIEDLKKRRSQIDAAINALETVTAGAPVRRGRPPAAARAKGRGPRHMSAAARRRISLAKKKWWAARKRGA